MGREILFNLFSSTLIFLLILNIQVSAKNKNLEANETPIEEFNEERYHTGTKLWEADVQNGILGTPAGAGRNRGDIFDNPQSNTGPAGTFSEINTKVKGRTGPKAIEMTLDMKDGSKGGVRHYMDDIIENNRDHIYTSWYFIPQDITSTGFGNSMQWKQFAGTTSHVVNAVYLQRRGNDLYLRSRDTDQNWRSNFKNNFQSHPTKSVPVNQWFGIKVRFTRSAPNSPDGRFTVWQIDQNGTHTLIGDHQNIINNWDKDATGRTGGRLMQSVNWYSANISPAVTSVFVDELSIHLPGENTSPGR